MTPYEKIYGRFLSKVEDHSFLDTSKFESEKELYDYFYDFLIGAVVKFKACESDLTESVPDKQYFEDDPDYEPEDNEPKEDESEEVNPEEDELLVQFNIDEEESNEEDDEPEEDKPDQIDVTYRYYGFKGNLTTEEIEILANLMVVEYLNPKIVSTQNMKQRLSDREYQMYSQSQHLSQMLNTQRYYTQISNQMISSYTYNQGLGNLM